MPKQEVERLAGVGARLAQLRKSAGYTQQELAEAVNTTQRMISYYETQAEPPPSALLPELARVLGVSVDQLLGLEPLKKSRLPDSRVLRRLQQIEALEPAEKRQVLQVLDAFIERGKLKKKAATG
jgi:transcriptional regulator with XRE-family HTH domain